MDAGDDISFGGDSVQLAVCCRLGERLAQVRKLHVLVVGDRHFSENYFYPAYITRTIGNSIFCMEAWEFDQ